MADLQHRVGAVGRKHRRPSRVVIAGNVCPPWPGGSCALRADLGYTAPGHCAMYSGSRPILPESGTRRTRPVQCRRLELSHTHTTGLRNNRCFNQLVNMCRWIVTAALLVHAVNADLLQLGPFIHRGPRLFGESFRPPFAGHGGSSSTRSRLPRPQVSPHESQRYTPPSHHHQQQQQQHHQQQQDQDRCALIVPGQNTDSRQYHINSGGSSEDRCISVESVNDAFNKAARKYKLKKSEHPDSQELGELGKALTDVTAALTARYNLSADVVANGLPLIDVRATDIDHFCPSFLNGYDKCQVKRYRTADGMCNNLKNPHWGAAHNTFRRLLAPSYSDGVAAMRVSWSGQEMPSARHVSGHLHKDLNLHDHAVTMMLVAWGQVIDHDITFTAEKHPEEKDKNGRPKMPDCCGDPRIRNDPQCAPIKIPADDSFYSLYGQKCMNMIRSLPGAHHQCKLGPRDPFSTVTAYLDASFVYGSDDKTLGRMRTYSDGLLKTLPVFREYGLKDLLPPNLHAPDEGCIRPKKEIFCFDAGDGRVNEQLVLAVIQTLFVREHNRIAEELAQINPHWNDEVIYQETRLIVGAEVQQITYNEFLPMVLGRDVMDKHKLLLNKNGKPHVYDETSDATASNEFISAAFRFGHSLLPSTIERWSTTGKYIDARRLSELLRQPYDLYKGGFSDQYAMGLISQVAQAMDDSVSQELTNHLFQMPENRFGMDLAAINMQRGREHGIRGYNDYREYCGLPRIHDFSQLRGIMSNNSFAEYANIYSHPDDIDLWSGGVSERPLPGAMLGPTLACVIGEQFHNLKYGDRFWHEQQGYPSSFTQEQIDEIRKLKLSAVICDNTDHIEKVQVYAMVLPDHQVNPLSSCASLPRIDLTRWRDLDKGHGSSPNPIYDSASPQSIMFVVPPPPGYRPRSLQPPVYNTSSPHADQQQQQQEYGPPPSPPQQQQEYGPPPSPTQQQQEYGPPPSPTQQQQEYGPPPSPTQQQQEYGPPPSPPQQQQQYGPPPSPPQQQQEYGPPQPTSVHVQQSSGSYGGPPPAALHEAPHPRFVPIDDSSPPRPVSASYGGLRPPPPSSSSYRQEQLPQQHQQLHRESRNYRLSPAEQRQQQPVSHRCCRGLWKPVH